MRTAAASYLPTRRELALLVLLCIALLCLVPSRYVSDSASSYLSKAGVVNELGLSAGDVEKDGSASGVSFPELRLTWKDAIPETEMLHHSPGWTIFDRLYIYNGTIYIVTSSPESIPELMYITSSGYDMHNGREEVLKRRPTDKDIRVISPSEAQHLFSLPPQQNQKQQASSSSSTYSIPRLTGVSFLNTDSTQFIAHYYHFSAEILFGLWRTYTALDPFITPDGHTALPAPRRFLFRHVPSSHWRDYAALNQWVLRGAFPNIGMEFEEDWADRARMGVPLVLDRVVLGDRAASYESEAYLMFWRYTASAFTLRGSVNWWAPLRRAVLEFSGLAVEYISGAPASASRQLQPQQQQQQKQKQQQNEKYVITYVSRQDWGRRMLRQADHEALVAQLHRLAERYGYEVHVVSMDKLSRAEQIALAGRTTVMMGVHGNGLTSLLWMRPSPRATVIEFFYPGGFAFDYEFTTRALGMAHFGVWDNETFTQPNVPNRAYYPEGFQGNEIPLDGAVVARLVHERLTLNADEPHP
ncbi:hypothetical protein ACEPAF_991 [Sanghuangporus sanghuang]